jgi:outer membrane protein
MAALALAVVPAVAEAGDNNGNFMVRLQGTYLHPGDDSTPAGLSVEDEVLPTATLTYFFTKNIAAELFCCFAKVDAELDGAGKVADFWVFPPALTLQYHFDSMNGFKPYLGAGVQYILPFSEDGKGALAGDTVTVDDALGFTLQAGVDVELGQGWYLNADVKKTWIDHDVRVRGATNADFEVELDPWIFSIGAGYRFNLF